MIKVMICKSETEDILMAIYHRFRWYATLENKTSAETFPKFPSVSRVIDRSDRNPPITATTVTFWPSLRHASGLRLVDFDPICR